MEMNIDLEEKNMGPMVVSDMGSESKKKYYPQVTLHYDEPFNLPKTGEVTFKFEEVEKSQRKTGGKTEYTCRLELQELVSSEDASEEKGETDETDEQPTKKYDEAGAALDKLASEKSKQNEGY